MSILHGLLDGMLQGMNGILGGGISSFNPTGQLLYLRADLGLNIAGGTWADQSGNGNNVVKVGTPTLSNGAIGGQDAIQFALGSYFQNTTATITVAGSAFTNLVVAKNGNGTIFTNRQTVQYHQQQFLKIGPTYYVDSDGVSFNYTIPDASAETQSAVNAFQAITTHSGTLGNILVWINRTSRPVTGNPLLVETGNAGFFVGHNAALQDWAGLIAEIRVLDHLITSDEITAWNSYCAVRYGL